MEGEFFKEDDGCGCWMERIGEKSSKVLEICSSAESAMTMTQQWKENPVKSNPMDNFPMTTL